MSDEQENKSTTENPMEEDWIGWIRVLTYGVIFERDLMAWVDRSIKALIPKSGPPEKFIEAIDWALRSKIDLAEEFQQLDNTDAEVREFLKACRARIVERF